MVWQFHWELCKENIEKWKGNKKGKVKLKMMLGVLNQRTCAQILKPYTLNKNLVLKVLKTLCWRL
jgi:hypothetical protein